MRQYVSVAGSPDDDLRGTGLIELLASGYRVRADISAVAKAISKRILTRPTRRERTATFQVLAILGQDPGNVARLQHGHDPPALQRRAMTAMVGAYSPRVPAETFVDEVVSEITSVLRGLSASNSADSREVHHPAHRRTPIRYSKRVQRQEECKPLWKGPLYGVGYCVAGIFFAVVAWLVGGIAGIPLAVVAVLLILAGAWTALFTGGMLLLIRVAERKIGK
jgi:hypothetical protein